ncbi:MAG: hypothetical protein ABGX04_10335 [Myxococcales bacterium]
MRFLTWLLLLLPSVAAGQPQLVGSVDISDTYRILSMDVAGDTVYLGMAESGLAELVAIDASDPHEPTLTDWSFEVGFDVNDLAISGNIAYLATGHPSMELMVLDLSLPTPLIASYDTPEEALTIAHSEASKTLLIGTKENADSEESYFFDVSDPANIVFGGAFEAGRDVGHVPLSKQMGGFPANGKIIARGRGAADPWLTFLATDDAANEFQVISNINDTVMVPDLNGDHIRHLACVGDSNTFPNFTLHPGTWCKVLRDAVWHPEFKVTNFPRIGATMTDEPNNDNDAYALLEMAIDADADLAILAFGTNDVIRRTPAQIVSAMRELDAMSGAANMAIWFATVPPRFHPSTPANSVEDTNALIAETFGPGQLMDFFSEFSEDEFQPVNVHVNQKGTRKRGDIAVARLRAASFPCADGTDNDGDGMVDFDGGQSIHGSCDVTCPPGVSDPNSDGRADPDPSCIGGPSKDEGRAAASTPGAS